MKTKPDSLEGVRADIVGFPRPTHLGPSTWRLVVIARFADLSPAEQASFLDRVARLTSPAGNGAL